MQPMPVNEKSYGTSLKKGFDTIFKWIGAGITLILIVPVKIYQWLISPMLPGTCRYIPTCSQYAIEALRVHGPVKGLLLGTKRIFSCHPWGGHGFDPVPPKGTPLIKFKKYKSGEKR
jgi:putative membrane protein insertion efficiency factor